MKKILSVLAILMILSLLTVIPAGAEDPAQAPYTARPSVNGRLQVTNSRLADESGNPVILRGISTHGLTWFPQYIDPFIFDQISEDWNCNLIRLAMYSELYCGSQKEESLELLKKGIDAATEADMYVLVDWHILNDSDPNEHINEALGFFREIASEYADHPNLIFEICNEPNGDTNWSDVRSYARQVIPAIREFIPDAVVVVGTPEYDQNLSAPILRPLDFNNVLYCLHFYAASHDKGLQEELRLAVEAKLPVFVSECGISESSGDGAIDFDSAASWFSYLESHGISFAVWSLCDKTESSAIFKHGFDVTQPITDADLSVAGTWVRELIRGKDPASIPAPAGRLDAAEVKDIVTWFTNSLEFRGMSTLRFWLLFAAGAVLLVLLAALGIIIAIKRRRNISRTYDQYYQKINALQASGSGAARNKVSGTFAGHAILIASIIATLIYLSWRVGFSLPLKSGVLAIASSGILLIVEVLGFIESLVLFLHMIHMKDHPLPAIPKDRYPDVDIFISTYNEPEDLLRRTINGCRHMEYPDLSKVHIWVCDDNHRPSMRALAEEMGVGYFDREDHKGAKAGNLNHAMSLTSAPYIVTFDADMIPKSDFLLKTIPYFVDIEIRNESLPPEDRRHLGLLQTPQCFYDPDVFQHALYSEKRVPNEQDFFYRTIEPAKTSTNSVIYGGSNTVLSRKALEDTGGFFTESITEDFATGLLIESKGYLSLAIPEPLASGQTPHTFREHIKQRTRWGRGVIVTGRKLKIFRRHDLSLLQKISYWSSVIYWYSPFKNLIYLIAPLIFAVFAIPVFYCNWLELLVFWLPMYILQDISLKINSQKKISHKWSGIYETSVMPHLLIPILKEFLGMSLTTFKVTDKTRAKQDRKSDWRAMIPFLILIVLSVAGIVRLLLSFNIMNIVSVGIILFWILKNLYLLVMAMFLVDGRDDDGEEVKVKDAEFVTILKDGEDSPLGGITTFLTEHSMTVYLDDNEKLDIGDRVSITVNDRRNTAILKGAVTGIHKSRKEQAWTQTIEILDYGDSQYEYWQILYDRIPTLPQTLQKDFGIFRHLWQNIAGRVSRTLQ